MLRVIGKVEIFKEIVDVVRNIIDEVKIFFTEDQLRIRAVDPGHISMVDLTVTKEAFDTYEVEGKVELGVNIEKFRNFIKLATADTDITFEVSGDTNELTISFGHIERKMLLIDTENLIEPNMPDLDLPGIATMKAKELIQVIEVSQGISDHIKILLSPDKLTVENVGDTGSAKLELPGDNLEELVCEEPLKSSFALEYFSKMVKAIGKSEMLTMEMANDHPIKLQFSVAQQSGVALYLLAPRIES